MWQHHEIGHGLRLLCFELHVFVFIFAIFKGFCIYFRHFHCRSPSFIRVYNIFSRILSAVYQVLNDQVEVQLPKVEVQVQREYREKDRIRPLTSAILPSYAPINHQPVRLDVTYDVIGNPHYPYVIIDLGLQLTLQPED